MVKQKKAPKTEVAKHTAGPWSFEAGDVERRAGSTVFKCGDKEFSIALVTCEWSNLRQRAEDLANAALISAAPELLDVAKMVATLDRPLTSGERAQVMNAIAKATEVE